VRDLMFDTQTSPHYTINGLALAEGEEKAVDLIFGKGESEVSGSVTGDGGAAVPGARLVFTWTRKSGCS